MGHLPNSKQHFYCIYGPIKFVCLLFLAGQNGERLTKALPRSARADVPLGDEAPTLRAVGE
jgi:hypothetical protein